MSPLIPAAELAAKSTPYPNDSPEYRTARRALLAEETELRRHIERVAAQRRALPPGGVAPDYNFLEGRSPVARQLAFARERGWQHMRFYQCVGDDFARDYRDLTPAGRGTDWYPKLSYT